MQLYFSNAKAAIDMLGLPRLKADVHFSSDVLLQFCMFAWVADRQLLRVLSDGFGQLWWPFHAPAYFCFAVFWICVCVCVCLCTETKFWNFSLLVSSDIVYAI